MKAWRTAAWAWGLALLAGCGASGPSLDTGGWHQDARQTRVVELVVALQTRNRANYRQHALDQAFVAEAWEGFLERLDPHGWLLTQAAWSPTLHDAWQQGLRQDLETARLDRVWAGAQHLRQAVRQRLAWVDQQLTQPLPPPPSTPSLQAVSPRAATGAELDAHWVRRLQEETDRLVKQGRTPEQARQVLRLHYQGWHRRLEQLSSDQVLGAFLNALLKAGDPHAEYLDVHQAANLDIAMRLYLDGVGLSFQAMGDEVLVETVFGDSPASESGLIQAGDRLVGVAQDDDGAWTDTTGMALDTLVGLVRGEPGTVVRLSFLRYGEATPTPWTVRLVRSKVDFPDLGARLDIEEVPQAKGSPLSLAVITLPSFYRDLSGQGRHASDDVLALLRKADEAGAKGVLLDLRHNTGGVLDEALVLADALVDTGPLLLRQDAYGQVEPSHATTPGVLWEGPLVILVSRQTASAAEVLAGALRDHGRAVVVGESTYGKGTYQSLLDLDRYARSPTPQYGQVKLTVGEFFRATGQPVQQQGIEPDIALPLTWGAQGLGEQALPHSLAPGSSQPLLVGAPLTLPTEWAHEADRRRQNPGAWAAWWSYWQVHALGQPTEDQAVPPAWPTDDVGRIEGLAILADAVRWPAQWGPATAVARTEAPPAQDDGVSRPAR